LEGNSLCIFRYGHRFIKPEKENPLNSPQKITAKQIMTTNLITASPDMEILEAAKLLIEKRINGVPVVDDSGKLVGILCQSDLIVQQKKLPLPSVFTFLDSIITLSSMKQLEKEAQKITATTVAHAMTVKPIAIKPDTSIETIAELMTVNKFHTLPVVENEKLVGIVGKEDVLKTLMQRQNEKTPDE
jgi:CBS domain-containing protein